MDPKGKIAIVTGAASGIGEATARGLATAGAQVVLVDLQGEALARVAASIPNSRHWTVDVSDSGAMEALARTVEEELGPAQILVNNAGITVLGEFSAHRQEDWQRVMGVNLFGVVNGCRSFLPQLRKKGGWIVNISSVFGIVGVPGQSAYCASKFAVRGLSEALWEELRGTNVGLTLVHPGGIRTGIVRDARVASGDPKTISQLTRFFDERTLPPEQAAAAIVTSIRREQRRLRICKETVVFDWLRRIAPETGNYLAVKSLLGAMRLKKLEG